MLRGSRPWTFWSSPAFFALFVLFLYGPMFVIYVLSFQGPDGGMTFPLSGVSIHWFEALIEPQRAPAISPGHSSVRLDWPAWSSLLTVVLSVAAGLAFRRRFHGSGVVFYIAIASLIMPGLFVGLGIGLCFNELAGYDRLVQRRRSGAQLTWTLPFGLLIMFAVLGRFNRAYEEAAQDLGASAWQRLAQSRCRSCCRASSAWRCSASRCPMTNSRAPC